MREKQGRNESKRYKNVFLGFSSDPSVCSVSEGLKIEDEGGGGDPSAVDLNDPVQRIEKLSRDLVDKDAQITM